MNSLYDSTTTSNCNISLCLKVTAIMLLFLLLGLEHAIYLSDADFLWFCVLRLKTFTPVFVLIVYLYYTTACITRFLTGRKCSIFL